MNRSWKVAISALIVVAVMATRALGGGMQMQPQQPKQKPAEVGDKAKKVLTGMAKYLSGLKSASMEIVTSVHIEAQGRKQDMKVSQDITMQRPNKLRINVKQGDVGNSLTSNGKKLYTYVSSLDVYKVSEAPKDFKDFAKKSDVVSGQMTSLGGTAGSPAVPALFSKDAYKTIIQGATKVQHVGVEKIKGKQYDRVRFNQPRVDWDVWIAQGENPAIHKIVPDVSKAIKQMQQQGGGQAPSNMKLDIQVQVAKWQANPDLTEDAFEFSPPEGAKEVSSWMEAIQQQRQSQGQGQGQGQQGQSGMVGQKAPDFTLQQLDGDKVKLSEHKGENVVVLDFWATWCPPCQKALPIVEKLTKKFEGKGVVIYAVDQREEAKKVRDFLKEKDLDLNVLLDTEGSVGQKFGVRSIPTTVVIGLNGAVQAVHKGYDPQMEEKLTTQLEKLLAGESLTVE